MEMCEEKPAQDLQPRYRKELPGGGTAREGQRDKDEGDWPEEADMERPRGRFGIGAEPLIEGGEAGGPLGIEDGLLGEGLEAAHGCGGGALWEWPRCHCWAWAGVQWPRPRVSAAMGKMGLPNLSGRWVSIMERAAQGV